MIQMKDLAGSTVCLDQATRIDHLPPSPNQLTRAGDIILRPRGLALTAALLRDDQPNTIVASPLFKIRPNTLKALPEFLTWWINSPSSQNYLASRAGGSAVQMINKQVLESLEVILPPLEQQQRIIEYYSLAKSEIHLLERLKQQKELHARGILLQMVTTPQPTINTGETQNDN